MHNYVNVVHRDIKPENLLIDENDVLKIADFGVSQIMENSDSLSNSTGTKAYLPTEAWTGMLFFFSSFKFLKVKNSKGNLRIFGRLE